MIEAPGMNLTRQVCHLRYCRIASESDRLPCSFRGVQYELCFTGKEFHPGAGLVVSRRSDSPFDFVDTELLRWLSIYVGEDLVSPHQYADTRFLRTRGTFSVSSNFLHRYLKACERFPGRTLPGWRRSLGERSLMYFDAAVRGGFNLMPLNIGFFGMCLECIGNFYASKRTQYFKLGEKRFLRLLHARLKRYKQAPASAMQARAFEKVLMQDVELVHTLRNAFYGHSLLHKQEHRRAVARLLRDWFKRNGLSERFVRASFPVSNLDSAVTREAHGLYKVGLRVCRTFLMMLLGFVRQLPYATHDFSLVGLLETAAASAF